MRQEKGRTDAFAINRVLTSIFFVLFVVVSLRLMSNAIYDVPPLEQPAYLVEGAPVTTGVVTSGAKEEAIPSLVPFLASADIEAGKKIARKCLQCHNFESEGKTKIGPSLWGIVGQRIARFAEFAYSKALKEKRGSWNLDALNQFLLRPQTYAKGTKMSFVGLKKEEDRANIIAYMNTMSPDPMDLKTLK